VSAAFSVRIRKQFTLADLRNETERTLQEIAPTVTGLAIDVVPDRRSYRIGRAKAARATPEELLQELVDPSPLLPFTILMTADADAAVGVSELDFGYAEDADGGRWLLSDPTVDRRPAAFLLSIAAAVAAGRLAASPVLDESLLLTGDRLTEPQFIVDRLRREGHRVDRLRDVAADILEQVGITSPMWRDPEFLDPSAPPS
jgi:hypothetical protein